MSISSSGAAPASMIVRMNERKQPAETILSFFAREFLRRHCRGFALLLAHRRRQASLAGSGFENR
jgi:hypothetical protein